MRYLVISDIHGNLPALAAVLRDCTPDQYDRVLVLGDLVGYGAEPGDVIERIRALAPHVVVRGNHDKAVCGLMELYGFNSHAREAAEWTARTLSEGQLAYLRDLPAGPMLVDDVLEVWHGSPADEDAYLVWIDDIRDAAALGRRPLCLFGHTHVQGAYGSGEGHPVVDSGEHRTRTTLSIRLEDRWLVNPGSVGQPRDGDPRAAYAIVDLGARTVTLCRVAYDVDAEMQAIRAAGLPELLASRLAEGR
ncbi:metallophosphoesterase family protein [Luteitalea sp.]|uniref:metallophosphoesterase family protein n=1 Tax=Luteitalea sp. TaxID=2004800 RepID=UPI0037C507B2